MYYNYYGLTVVNKRVNKLKIALIVLIVIIVVALSTWGGITYARYLNEKKIQEENARIEQERIAEEKRQEEIRKAEEAKRLKNAEPLSEEQMQSIEHIYNSDEKRVFLTFDDGPTSTVTPLILDLLKQENIKATFFVLGNRANANPDLIKREFEEGHYIANHGYSHKYSQIYSKVENPLEEYNYTEECIQNALGNPDYHSRLFRFPGGSIGGYYNNLKSDAKQLLRDNNIASLDWNALSNDAAGSNTKEEIMDSIISTTGEKSSVVVLMHDAYDKMLTYETLPDVIQFFRENGYTFMNLYDIL